MQGLTLSRKYFEAHGLPLIESRFGHVRDRIAAGLVGDGSECFGFDDELSRDHDWGPGFCVWLTADDYLAFGPALQEAIDGLPTVFEGFGPRRQSRWGQDRVCVFEIGAFYRRFIGCGQPPDDPEDWLMLPETALAACTNGEVFTDPPDEFSRRRRVLLDFYPEDVRLKKIASRCMTIGQSGQYNYPRCVKRGDVFGARYAMTKFCADYFSAVFLLNKRYLPFYKWVGRAASTLPLLGPASLDKITRLMGEAADPARCRELIESLCADLVGVLRAEALTEGTGDFLADHGPEVQRRIQHPGLRERDVWIG
ncbi:MAG: DUF4037 domain-containing protein [Thermodesulfobacteriota bacterium]